MRPHHIRILTLIIGICILSYDIYSAVAYNLTRNSQNTHFKTVPFQKGMSFTTWGAFSYNSEETREEFRKMKDIGVEWVAVNQWFYQDYLNSTYIYADPGSDSLANASACFLHAKSLGMHIMFKPMLNLAKAYDWRSYIVYTENWMNNYTAWMVECAKAAEAGQAEMLCLGTEMGNMQVHPEGVKEMIRQVREVYHGLLTYSANHDSFMNIEWYDDLDIIGISMYSMMTTALDPSATELQKVWDGMYYELEELSMKWNKPIAFTEIGIQARDGSNMIPNDNQISNEKDLSEMENFYLSLFQSRLWQASWFKGAYWWIWDFSARWNSNLKDFNPMLVSNLLHDEYSKDHIIENPGVSIWRSCVPLFLAIIAFILLYLHKGFEMIDYRPFNTNPEKSNERIDPNSVIKDRDIIERRNDILVGILFGCFFANMFSNVTMQFYNVIQKTFSYAIILQLSPTLVLLTFLCGMILGLLLSIVILRYIPKLTLVVLFFLVISYPYLSLGNYIQTLFIKSAGDFLVHFLLISAILLQARQMLIRNLLRIIGTAVFILALYLSLMVFFDLLAQIFLGIPIALVMLLQKSSNGPKPSKIQHPEHQLVPYFDNMNPSSSPRMAALLWGIATFAGMMIPFGNSVINLVRTTNLALVYYYFPAIIVLFAFNLIILVSNRGVFLNERLMHRKIFTSRFILLFGLGIVGLGFIYTLFVQSAVFWGIISGIYLFLFLGLIMMGYIPHLNDARIGRNYLYLLFISIFYIIGFFINGIKGLMIYLVTFLVVKDGSFVRRDPKIDPVPNFDVPLVLNSIILVIAFVLIVMLLSYHTFQQKRRANKGR